MLTLELGSLFVSASRFQWHRQDGEVSQGFLVVGAFLAAGLFQAVPQDFGVSPTATNNELNWSEC